MERRSTLTGLILLAALMVVACAFSWAFLVNKSADYRAEAEELAQDVADATIRGSRELSVRQSLDEVRASTDDVLAYFIEEEKIPVFISVIEGVALENSISVDITSINLTGSPEDSMPRSLFVRLAGTGTWEDVITFVSSLDALPYALNIQSISLDAGEEGWRVGVDLVQFVTK